MGANFWYPYVSDTLTLSLIWGLSYSRNYQVHIGLTFVLVTSPKEERYKDLVKATHVYFLGMPIWGETKLTHL